MRFVLSALSAVKDRSDQFGLLVFTLKLLIEDKKGPALFERRGISHRVKRARDQGSE